MLLAHIVKIIPFSQGLRIVFCIYSFFIHNQCIVRAIGCRRPPELRPTQKTSKKRTREFNKHVVPIIISHNLLVV